MITLASSALASLVALQDVPQAPSAPGPMFWIIYAVVIIFIIASMWKVFTKAGQPGWAAIVPIYNLYILCKIGGKPGWFVLLFLIPLVNIYAMFAVPIAVAHRFGKGTGFGVGLALLGFIFYPILAFGDAQYTPPPPTGAAPAFA